MKYKKFYISIIKISLKYSIIVNSILGIITLALVSYLLASYATIIPIELIIIIFVALIIYFSISMYSIIRTHTLEKTRKVQKLYIAFKSFNTYNKQ